jgi:hypothetical protein
VRAIVETEDGQLRAQLSDTPRQAGVRLVGVEMPDDLAESAAESRSSNCSLTTSRMSVSRTQRVVHREDTYAPALTPTLFAEL